MSGPRPADDWPLAIWLLPAEPDASRWQQAIDGLATRHGSPPFAAHVTVHVGRCAGGNDPVRALQAVAAETAAITLDATATEESASFFKTLFVPLPGPAEGRAAIERLRRRLAEAWLGGQTEAVAAAIAAYPLEPHLSLLYANLGRTARLELARTHDASGQRIRFDRLAFVKPGPRYTDLSTTDKWQVFGHCRLGGNSTLEIDDRQESAGFRS